MASMACRPGSSSARRIKQLRQQIQDLQQENARLRDHIERLKSDPDAIEHEAREQLHYARPGEVIYTCLRSRKPKRCRLASGK